MRQVRSYIKRDRIRGIIQSIIIIGLLVAVIALGVRISKRDVEESTITLSFDSYQVATCEDVSGKVGIDLENNSCISTRTSVPLNGLKIEILEKDKIQYKLIYIDKDEAIVEETEYMTTDFDSETCKTIPEDATSVYIVIEPLGDEDGITSLVEMWNYSKLLNVTYIVQE